MRKCKISSQTIILLFSVVLILSLAIPAMAQDSLLLNYQGQLTDAEGNPLNSRVVITFSIHSNAIDPEYLWMESHDVTVTSGLFSVLLGSVNPLPDSIFNDADLYLGIVVGADPELTPRTLLASAPKAAVTRRVHGDIETYPGVIQIYPPDPCTPEPCNPAVTITASNFNHTITINQPPPDDNMTGITMGTSTDMNMFKINWGNPPDDSQPAFEVVSDATLEKVSMELKPPPDDSKPGIELTVDALTSTGTFRIGMPPPDDNKPSVEITTSTNTATLTLQGEDAAGAPPKIVMSADATAAKLGIGTTNLIEALTVIGNGWFSGDVYTFTDTKGKSNIVPIDEALEKVSRLNGYYYDLRTDKYPELRFSEDRQIGFLAEEVNKVAPEAVGENELGLTGVSYGKITALLVEAVKELKAENEKLKTRIDALESE